MPISPTLQKSDITNLVYSDPRLKKSWFYEKGSSDLKIDVESVWEDYLGNGVKVGVIDSQIDFTHDDLARAYELSLDYDFGADTAKVTIDQDALPNPHGTMVAGVISAEGNNGIGSVGIASEATLVGLAMDYSSDAVIQQALAALQSAQNVDVLNNSWTFSKNFEDNFAKSNYRDFEDALDNLVTNGRDGLGTSVVFAAGNAGPTSSSNYHNMQNSPMTIAVGAVDAAGNPSAFTSLGANVLVSAPGRDVYTTDLKGRFEEVAGTSFAAPAVSAVIALMLEANPDLGYRDIQKILALSARREGLTDEALHGDGWQYNGAAHHNGGGMHHSDAFGFGFVNAHDAVRLAETWDVQSTLANRATFTLEQDVEAMMIAGENDHIAIDFEVTDDMMVEHVQVSLDFRWLNTADLDIYLTSPDGTSVRLVYDLPADGRAGSIRDFALSSVSTMGEMAKGTWMVDVFNRDPDAKDKNGDAMNAEIESVKLVVHGSDQALEDDVYVYTDEFGTLYSDTDMAARHVLNDTDGGDDTINASAITSDTVIDLSGRTDTSIAGIQLDLRSALEIENAYTGDGDDILIGNALDNRLIGGRGNDQLYLGAGQDYLDGGAGQDTLLVDGMFSSVSGYFTSAGTFMLGFIAQSYSAVAGIEIYKFADVSYSFAQVANFFGGDQPAPETNQQTPPPVDEEEPVSETPVADPILEDPEPSTEPVVDHKRVSGTDKSDKLRTGNEAEIIYAKAGDDAINARSGDDIVYGGAGRDKLKGEKDDDFLYGEDGHDLLFGGNGNDLLYGGDGDDLLSGGRGDDVLYSGAGRDKMKGGAGADTFVLNIHETAELDVIRDFSASEGDRIQLAGLEGASSEIAFELIKKGSATHLVSDIDGISTDVVRIFGADLDQLEFAQDVDSTMFIF